MLATMFLGILLVFSSVRGDDLFSKFHQSVYKLKECRGEVINYDENLLSLLQVKTFKYNRTTAASNVTFRLKKDVSFKIVEILMQVYKQYSNEYRAIPVRYQKNAQLYFSENVVGVQSFFTCGNFTSLDVYRKDVTYHICNYVPDERLMPPLVPTGQYKAELGVLYPEKEVAALALYFEIYVPFKYD